MSPAGRDHRLSDVDGPTRHIVGDDRHKRAAGILRRLARTGDRAGQGRERSAIRSPPGPFGGLAELLAPGGPERLVDDAGQGQSGHRRIRQSARVSDPRQRRRRRRRAGRRQLQLNAMLPSGRVRAAQQPRGSALRDGYFAARCIGGIVVDRERTADLAQHDLGELSSIAALEGYALATRAATSSRDARRQSLSHSRRSRPAWRSSSHRPRTLRGGADARGSPAVRS